MILSIIVAHDENNCIGKNNTIPWNIPSDLKMFKQVTMGKPIIMGRKTHESIGRPLPGRLNIIMSRDMCHGSGVCDRTDGDTIVKVVSSYADAIRTANLYYESRTDDSDKEVFVIGGGSIYEDFVKNNVIDNYYITLVHGKVIGGDTFFPKIDYKSKFYSLEYKEHHPADYTDRYDFTFMKYTSYSGSPETNN